MALRRATTDPSRSSIVVAAVVMVVALAAGAAIVALTSGSGDRDRTLGATTEQELVAALAEEGALTGSPDIIPDPSQGRAPEDPGDPGGWQQLALFGLLAASLVGIGVVVFRGGKRSQANRARWHAAAATGRDGAADELAAH